MLTVDSADQRERHLAPESGRNQEEESLVNEAQAQRLQFLLESCRLEFCDVRAVVSDHILGLDQQEGDEQQGAAFEGNECNVDRRRHTNRLSLASVHTKGNGGGHCGTDSSNHPLHANVLLITISLKHL